MSIYAVTQDMISYLQLVQTFSQNPQYYPPATVLQGIYAPAYYSMLEEQLGKENMVAELKELTRKALHKLVPFVQTFCPDKLTIGYDDSKYDPTIRFYYSDGKQDQLLGFLDLPLYKFFYLPSKKEQKLMDIITDAHNKIKTLSDKRDQVLDEYDYTKQEGTSKFLMRMSKKENYREAQSAISKYDRKIAHQRDIIDAAENRLEEERANNEDRAEWIRSLQQSFAMYGITSAEMELDDSDKEPVNEEDTGGVSEDDEIDIS